MTSTNRVAEVGQLIGEPARAAMLGALMDGRALTAAELAGIAGIAPQTASGHLGKLTAANLLTVAKQGRHRYHRLASTEVARLLESIMQIAGITLPEPVRRPHLGPRDAAMRAARTCYDHFAGGLGVAIADALQDRGAVEFDDGAGIITARGLTLLANAGIALPGPPRKTSRPLCRPCLDWSERRPHIAGKLGAAIRDHFMQRNFVVRIGDTRAVTVTPKGAAALRDLFGIHAWA